MDARKRWRRAMITSIVLNIFLLGSVGILSAEIFKIEPVEQLIELDLVSSYSSQQLVDTSQEKASTSTAATQMVAPLNMTSSSPVAVQAVTSLSIDEVSIDSIADHEVGETQAASSPISSGAGGNSTANASSGQSSNGKSKGGQVTDKSSGGIVGPQILSQVHPTYPEEARQAGKAGTVLLKVQILENGRAGDVSIKQSSGNDLLDQAAVAAVYKWHFAPAKEKNTGRAVVCYTTLPVVFRLN